MNAAFPAAYGTSSIQAVEIFRIPHASRSMQYGLLLTHVSVWKEPLTR